MIFSIPMAIIFGILTIISLFITATFGLLTVKGKPVFKYHKFFAITTLTLALIHAVLALLLWVYGITI